MKHRIISLLPSATEIVAALGHEELLVGRSHECDFPPSVKSLPVCCEASIDVSGSSREIDHNVRTKLQDAISIYRVKTETIRRLDPTVIITQTQCDVCAVSLDDVNASLSDVDGCNADIIAVAPMKLCDIWDDVTNIAERIGDRNRGISLVKKLQDQLESIAPSKVNERQRPTVVCIEWLDPLMTAGNWTPELVSIAGGNPLLCEAGKHSPWITWDDLRKANPDYLIIMPCGFGIERTRQELDVLTTKPGWQDLCAVRKRRVFIADGNQYFNRPGPRVVESAEIIAEILGTSSTPTKHQGHGWQQISSG